MKVDCNKRENRLLNWHRWFAWYPVHVGKNDCRWLEVVMRKGVYGSNTYDEWWDWSHKPVS